MDFEDDDWVGAVVELVNLKIDPWRQQTEQPVLHFFVADFGLARLKRRADDVVGTIFDAPNHVGRVLAMQSGRVRKRRQVFADLFRLGFVVLELDPFGFFGQRAQLGQEF